ncbi:M20/M25/M40 family metallo-hydrolase [Cyanobium sp. FGCU-6]|nr:M20/M25/M40 family metallo-hydrolase [Cyanobium sp. FGCU6]
MTRPALNARLLAHLQELARPRHAQWDPLGLLSVRSYLREHLQALGTVEEHAFQEDSEAGINLILRLPGRNADLAPLLVGAHYDGPLQSIGADDNASGVAALLELASRWSQHPPRRPVWIVAFDQEEWGMLGSRALARELRTAGQPLELMVSLEMLAFTSEQQAYPVPGMRRIYGVTGDFIALIANVAACPMLPALARAMGRHVPTRVLPVPFAGRPIPDVRLSDHSPFWDQGYDALMVTDTSFMRNPNYHRMSDTIDTLDLPFLCGVVEGLAEGLGRL